MGDSVNTIRAFDSIASNYDESVNSNPIMTWMRMQVWNVYNRYFKRGHKILELNAGTGIDAIHLAKQGINVHATDASHRMTEIIRSKTNGLSDKVTIQPLCFSELSKIELSDFDGVISNFGGLNCINDFSEAGKQVASKLKPGGIFVAVVMNKICPWEFWYYLLKLRPGKAIRRLSRHGIDVNIEGIKVRTYYFTPGHFASSFGKHFSILKTYSLGLFTPPPYLKGIYSRVSAPVRFMMKVDEKTSGLFPFNRFGDHFIAVFKKS